MRRRLLRGRTGFHGSCHCRGTATGLRAAGACHSLGTTFHGGHATAAARPDTGTQIVLLGTRAGPGVDLKRAQTATAILVDGVPYLVDCGYGAVRNLTRPTSTG